MKVRLTKKLADVLNGMDLRPLSVGDELDLDDSLALMLLAERWAEEIVAPELRGTADDRRQARSVSNSPRARAASPRRLRVRPGPAGRRKP